MVNPVIETRHLYKYYGHSRGIEDVSLEVEQGDIFGFIGPNGAGKSTTIRILLNFIFPGAGSASIFGKDVVKDSKIIRKRIGYVPSEANLYDGMKVIEFLRYTAAFYEVKESRERITKLAGIFELDTERKVAELSSGNKKKVKIIQSLVHSPELLILDEPTTGLDPLMQSRLFDLLREENKKGVTVFFSSHILSEVQSLCHKVAFIKDGKIIRSDEISSLREKQIKKVRIHFSSAMDAASFSMPGMERYPVEEPEILNFLFSGDINDLSRKIALYKIQGMNIEDLSLEEIFLHYYQ